MRKKVSRFGKSLKKSIQISASYSFPPVARTPGGCYLSELRKQSTDTKWLDKQMSHSIKIVRYANRYVGIKFRRNRPDFKIDCSLFTQMVFAKYGIPLPRTSGDQAKQGIRVNNNDLRPGDLVFFHIPDRNPKKGAVGHVAIYAGKQEMIHCLPTSNFVLTDMNKPYWKSKYLFARRILK